MSAAVAELTERLVDVDETRQWRSDAGADGETTLEQLVSRAWEGLAVRAIVVCPACGDGMEPQASGAGRCRRCLSELV